MLGIDIRPTSLALILGPYTSGGVDLSAYAANSQDPVVIADFQNATEFYHSSDGVTTFDDMFVYAGTSMATMFHNGVMKWKPHNLIENSESWVNWTTATGTPVKSVSWVQDDDSSGYEAVQSSNFTTTSGIKYGFSMVVTQDAVASSSRFPVIQIDDGGLMECAFDTSTGVIRNIPGREFDSVLSTDNGDGTFTVDMTWTGAGNFTDVVVFPAAGSGSDISTVTTANYSTLRVGWITASEMCVTRRDLGGVAPNASKGRPYAFTTTAEAYADRRGHEVWNGSAYEKAGILMEPTVVNAISYSNNFSFWTNTNTGDSSGHVNGITGVSDAMMVTEVGGFNRPQIYRNTASLTGGAAITYSFFAKKNQRKIGRLFLSTTGVTQGIYARFDLDLGVIDTPLTFGSGWANARSGIQDYGNGWYRVWITGDAPASAQQRVYIEINNDASARDYTTTSGWGFYVFGNQVEQAEMPTSYIPTQLSYVTRNYDSLRIPYAKMDHNTTAMSFAMDCLLSYANLGALAQDIFYWWYGDLSNQINADIDTYSATTGEINVVHREGGISWDSYDLSNYSPGAEVAMNFAARHTTQEVQGGKDGSSFSVNTSPDQMPQNITNDLYLHYNPVDPMIIRDFRKWSVDIAQAGLTEATT